MFLCKNLTCSRKKIKNQTENQTVEEPDRMRDVTELIESGLLELYVLGQASAEEQEEIGLMANLYPEISREIEEIEKALQKYASLNSKEPSLTLRPIIMATVDYTIRLENGENPGNPPLLDENSTAGDYSQWLDRQDMVPGDYDDIFLKLIFADRERTIGIVWIREMAPEEVHKAEYESFLILEGTCDITVGNAVYRMVPGSFLRIPLHLPHRVKVTSAIPCKVILQRLAA